MQLLLSRAGLVLNPGQVADLVLAWRQLAGLIATLPRDRPLADDMALVFRLSPPAEGVPQRRAPAKPARPKDKAKSTAKRRTPAKPAPRKRKRRGQ